jgi:carbon storage regulator
VLKVTRRVDEAVMIGTEVTVTVMGIKGNQVRIGIEAPKHVAVHRQENYARAGGRGGRERVRCERNFDAASRGSEACFGPP